MSTDPFKTMSLSIHCMPLSLHNNILDVSFTYSTILYYKCPLLCTVHVYAINEIETYYHAMLTDHVNQSMNRHREPTAEQYQIKKIIVIYGVIGCHNLS